MSETEQRFDVVPRDEVYSGVHEFEGSWELKLFLMTAAHVPFGQVPVVRPVVATMLSSISARMSPEFDYGRFGFAIVHTGRRGISVTVTHFGGWGTTFEVFCSGWYRYGHEFEGFELLDDIEPAMCWFEARRSFEEIRLACALARTLPLSGVRTQYLSIRAPSTAWPPKLGRDKYEVRRSCRIATRPH